MPAILWLLWVRRADLLRRPRLVGYGAMALLAGLLPYVYVPSNDTGTVTVIDQATHRTVRTLRIGKLLQHVVPDGT